MKHHFFNSSCKIILGICVWINATALTAFPSQTQSYRSEQLYPDLLDSVVTYNGQGIATNKTSYQYNSEGNVTQTKEFKKSYDNQWFLSSKSSTEYSPGGTRKIYSEFPYTGSIPYYKISSVYDSINRRIFYEEYRWDDAKKNHRGYSKEAFTYNSFNLIDSSETYIQWSDSLQNWIGNSKKLNEYNQLGSNLSTTYFSWSTKLNNWKLDSKAVRIKIHSQDLDSLIENYQ